MNELPSLTLLMWGVRWGEGGVLGVRWSAVAVVLIVVLLLLLYYGGGEFFS